MIDGDKFFGHVRGYFGNLEQPQVDGFNNIFAEWEKRQLTDKRWLAYMLATCWWESGREMQPVTERGSEEYLKSRPYYPWIGRGLVQTTWEVNYNKFGTGKDKEGRPLWVDLPEAALTWPVALRMLFEGMLGGMYTGVGLPYYFNAHTNNPEEARRIINGLDRASLIAGFHGQFLIALT